MKRFITISLLLVALVGCKKKDDTEDKSITDPLSNFKQIDLSTSDMLLYRKIKDADLELFSITTAGEVIKQFLPVGEDSLIPDHSIESVISLSTEYFHIVLENKSYDDSTFLINKQTGAVYPFTTTIGYNSSIETDNLNNIYYLNDESQLVRVNLSNPQTANEQIISFPEDHVSYFAVSHEGNVVYDGDYDSEDILRGISINGEMKSLPHTGSWTRPFLGTDGIIHYLNELPDNTDDHLFDVSFAPIDTKYNTITNDFPTSFNSMHIIKGKQMYLFNTYYGLFHLDKNNILVSSIQYIDLEFDKLVNIEVNDDFYYIAYQTKTEKFVLAKVEPVSGTFEKLIDGRYEISNFAVKADNTVYFKALDTQEFTSVIGKISPSKEITILAKDFSGDVTFIPLQ